MIKEVSMNNFRLQELKDRFNQASSSVRVLTIFSSTCLECQYGQAVVRELFKEIDTKTLQGFFNMASYHEWGHRGICAGAVGDHTGRSRRAHLGSRTTSWGAFRRVLKLKGRAWDVYLLYAPGVVWSTDEAPAPTFWMHQLPPVAGADGKLLLNPGRFSHELLNLLGKGDAHMAWDMAFKLHAKSLGDVKRERAQSSLEEVFKAVDPTKDGIRLDEK